MTRFVYVADTHIGGGKDGYRQQERYPEYLDELFAGLRAWIEEHQVDFLLHGGDITNEGTKEQIETAVRYFDSLGLPYYACLGNHDLFYTDSHRHWLAGGACFLIGDSLNFKLETPDMLLYSFSLHWDSRTPPYYWNIDLPQTPLPDIEAMAEFEDLLQTADRPVAVLIHVPLNSIPARQTGLAEDIHIPNADLREYFLDKASRFPHFKLVLAAHSHVNTLDTGSGLLT
ncbi:MAG: metallophosphoesterase, partial [bacterium]|nr:metallophosphoesterase [bacterium]